MKYTRSLYQRKTTGKIKSKVNQGSWMNHSCHGLNADQPITGLFAHLYLRKFGQNTGTETYSAPIYPKWYKFK